MTAALVVPRSDPLYLEMVDTLHDEAYILDHADYWQWLGLLSDDLEYRAPALSTRERSAASPYSTEMFHFDETFSSMEIRIRRFDTELAWSEDPPSRFRRFVSNIKVTRTDRTDEVGVRSYVLLTRTRHDHSAYQMITCERHDVWRAAEGWKLRRRDIYIDQTALTLPNLAFFL
jgi:3-phenylpropionate/cinnamic acid dioxygenase small subunit